MFPHWLHILAVASLVIGFACASVIVIDELGRPQKMWIMNLVWPLTALFGSVLWLTGYFLWGRGMTRIAEWLAFGVPAVAVALGWKSLFAEKTFAVWVLDYLFAFALGIVFQYYTIKPMRHLSVKDGIIQALKADFLSITAWQIGMYGFMAFAQFAWFARVYGTKAEVNAPEFWFVMQLAMLCGFVTAYPVNWILIKVGVKEQM